MSEQGKTYLAFIENELKAERDRRTAYDTRGQALVTTSGALVTLLGGLAALVKTGTPAQVPPTVAVMVCVALLLLAGAAGCGIVAGWNRVYAVATTATMREMLTGHWKDNEIDARNNVATLHRHTVATLRQANTFKARWVSTGLLLQLTALLALAVAVTLIITKT